MTTTNTAHLPTIAASTVGAPPVWALLERSLFEVNEKRGACKSSARSWHMVET